MLCKKCNIEMAEGYTTDKQGSVTNVTFKCPQCGNIFENVSEEDKKAEEQELELERFLNETRKQED